ncbi:unnamed protein product [Dovyalis caffra]|uniref:Uncharacterized protein n=1 Tax=Dovyalis caffra TaxID=77055 RepID=A0AAV1S7V7_9ROSI|nr:unnamed protein product [Dovyalis caffra]
MVSLLQDDDFIGTIGTGVTEEIVFYRMLDFGVYSRYASQAATSLQQECEPFSHSSEDEYADVDWDNLGFGLMPTDYMYMMKCSKDGSFEQGQLSRYGNIELSPAAGVLNYGQASCT